MKTSEKSVFICYRHTNQSWALAIYQYLVSQGYDVFIDYLNIPPGDFEQVIIENIRGRAHFIVILTPSALKGSENPNDWLRREIEIAMSEKRNIIPLMLDNFDFESPATRKTLVGGLANLKKYQGLNVPSDFFFEAMNRLCAKFLTVPLNAVIHPISDEANRRTKESQNAANNAPEVTVEELSAVEWYERGQKAFITGNFEEAIHCLTQAIRLRPDFADSYLTRGSSFYISGNTEQSISDYKKALTFNPDVKTQAAALNNLGDNYVELGDLPMAKKMFLKRIEIEPKTALAAEVSLGAILRYLGEPGSEAHIKKALTIADTYDSSLLSESAVLEGKAIALLCSGNKTQAISTLKDAIAKSKPNDRLSLGLYALLRDSQNPPAGVKELIQLLE